MPIGRIITRVGTSAAKPSDESKLLKESAKKLKYLNRNRVRRLAERLEARRSFR